MCVYDRVVYQCVCVFLSAAAAAVVLVHQLR